MSQSNPSPNYFVMIPTHILKDKRVDSAEAILFGYIASLSNDKGYCELSDKELGELTDVSDKEISKRLRNLEKSGHILRDTQKLGLEWDRKIYPVFGGVK